MNLFGYFRTNFQNDPKDITVSVAESVTAGALSNSLCSEAGSSDFFRGGLVLYSIQSKKDLLGIDIKYAEAHNFANPFTTEEMAKAVVKKFNSRIGISTTGYSLPTKRAYDGEKGYCALDVKIPYGYVCLHDALLNHSVVVKYEFPQEEASKNINRANVQVKLALKATQMYKKYVELIKQDDIETVDLRKSICD